MTIHATIGAAFVSATATWLLLLLLLRSGLAGRIALDRANARSLHEGVVPRVGGLVVVGVSLGVVSIATPNWYAVAAMTGSLMLLGWLDDRYGMPLGLRLAAHLLAAFVAAVLLTPAASTWQWLLLTLVLAWAMNLYNFMDGSDGLAGGMALFGFGTYAVAAFFADSLELALLSACIAGASAGFLPHNLAPARVFLGDAGSVPLGFLAGVLGTFGWTSEVWPAWFPLLVFSPFLVDASMTLLRRALRGERVWQAHREHLYQRMVRSGLGHGQTAILWYVAMATTAASALAALSWSFHAQFGLLVAWVAIYATVFALTWHLGT